MKLFLAYTALVAAVASANPFAPMKSQNSAQAAYVSSLMRGATPTANSQLRLLQDNNGQYQVDLTTYSVKFAKCQFVKAYSDDLAEDEDSDTVLGTKRFVIFKLCPNNSCSSCNYDYGEYIIDLEEYLEATVKYQTNKQQAMCEACQDCATDDAAAADGGRFLQDVNVNCDTCYEECLKIQNMNQNGYIDATNFLECQMIYDPEDDSKSALFAGPMCASNGAKIKIGVFKDEYCNVIDSSKDVDEYLMDADGYQMKLSHALLKTVYAEDSCVSCVQGENNNNNNNNHNNNNNQVLGNEMCQTLYQSAAKCETYHGFDSGYSSADGYSNQASQEDAVCGFIDSIKVGSYSDEGEIVVNGGKSTTTGGGAKTTGGQKFALTFFILGTVGLAVYAAMLHSKLTKGGHPNLSYQGGAMA
jgi:hypothetical protein